MVDANAVGMVTAGCDRRHREKLEASENLGQKLTGFIMATLAYPQQNPLDFNVLGTQKGPWLIRVDTVISEEKGANVSLQLVLHRLHEENPDQTRRLYAVVPASDLEIPQERVLIADRIRNWIENTQGNGFLDLRSHGSPFPG